MSASLPGRTTLYRLFDADGALMYIGVTNQLPQRLAAHRAADRFFGVHVARVDTEEFGTRDGALEAETAAIRAESPYFNVQDNWTHSTLEVAS